MGGAVQGFEAKSIISPYWFDMLEVTAGVGLLNRTTTLAEVVGTKRHFRSCGCLVASGDSICDSI
jgi:hypothetical protein